MIKRVGILTFLMLLLTPLSVFAEYHNDFDFENGILDNNELIKNINLPIEMYDNDLNTYYTISGNKEEVINFVIEFEYLMNINGIYRNFNDLESNNEYVTSLHIYFIDSNGSMNVESINRQHDNGYSDLDFENVVKIEFGIINNKESDLRVYEVDFFGSYEIRDEEPEPGQPGDTTPPAEVSNVNVDTTEDSATITFDNPDDVDFSHVNVYFDGEVYESDTGQVYIDGLSPETSYTATIKTVDTLGNESDGIEINFTTKEEVIVPPQTPDEVPEVRDLQIEASEGRADLSWKNPPQFFDIATIYRKDLGSVAMTNKANWNPFAPAVVSADSGYKPLFETNGTTFADLTIEPEHEYEYKVTNTWNGMESKGVYVALTVPKPPPIDMDELEIPFGATELIKSGNGLLAIIGGFILLALSFVIVPKVIATIGQANAGGSAGLARTERMERIGRQPRLTERQINLATTGGRITRQPRLTQRQMKGV